MKSIMEEASTITKAIENAWNRAGQPQEFSVKILELPQTSFFGLKTAKSAKIALLFNEATVKFKEQAAKPTRPIVTRPTQSRPHSDQPERSAQPQRRYQPRDQQPRDQQRPERSPEQRSHERSPDRAPEGRYSQGPRPDQRRPQGGPRPAQPRHDEPRTFDRSAERENWSPEMVDAAHDWLKETLVLMGKPDIKIIPHVSHNYLKLSLDQQVMDDFKQEETQLKSWGSLAMEAVREKVRKPLRSLRIILESNPSRRS